jgi:hypothetical protein
MSTINDGGPAFPICDVRYGVGADGECRGVTSVSWLGGMTLRDWFAGQALQGWLSTFGSTSAQDVMRANLAEFAYQIADAMIAQRSKT